MIDNIQISKLNYILLSLRLKQFPFLWIRDNISFQKISEQKRKYFLSNEKKKFN